MVLKSSPLIGRLLSIKGSKAVVSFGGQRRDQDLPLRDLVPIDSRIDFRYPYKSNAIEAELGLSIWLTGGIDSCVSKVPGKLKSDWGYPFGERWYRSESK